MSPTSAWGLTRGKDRVCPRMVCVLELSCLFLQSVGSLWERMCVSHQIYGSLIRLWPLMEQAWPHNSWGPVQN